MHSDTYGYSPVEVRGIVEHCRGLAQLRWLADVVTALATTGMRIGELAALHWSNIDLENRVIALRDNRHSALALRADAVSTTKGRRGRNIPIHSDLYKVLLDLPRRRDGHAFVGPRGGKLKPDTVRSVLIREVIARLKDTFATSKGQIGFEHGRLHSFRHYFVSQAFLGGASEGEIREWVGHRDSRMVERYRHLRSEEARKKMEQIDFIGGDVVKTLLQTTNDKANSNRAATGSDVPSQPVADAQ